VPTGLAVGAGARRYIDGAAVTEQTTSFDPAGRPFRTETVVPATTGWIDTGLAKTYYNTFTYYPDGSVKTRLMLDPEAHRPNSACQTANDYGVTRPGNLPATGETFVSTSLDYASKYSGALVEIATRSGTMARLARMGVRNGAEWAAIRFPGMPVVSKGWASTKAFFKYEGKVLNIGLRNGAALGELTDP